jgi:hypothetical protein
LISGFINPPLFVTFACFVPEPHDGVKSLCEKDFKPEAKQRGFAGLKITRNRCCAFFVLAQKNGEPAGEGLKSFSHRDMP